MLNSRVARLFPLALHHVATAIRDSRPLVALVTLTAATFGLSAFDVTTSGASASWGPASEIPGTASLNVGGDALLFQVSCSGVGNCGSVGTYTDSSGHTQAFVANESNGVWGNAMEIPGWAALNVGGKAGTLFSIACTAPGSCGVGGSYTDGSNDVQAFVDSETNGTWASAIEVPGTAALNVGAKAAQVTAISCNAPGNCSVGGSYTDSSQNAQAFVASQVNGTWGNAIAVPGVGAIVVGGSATILSLSCPSSGNCGAEGLYKDPAAFIQTFVVSEVGGTWGNALDVPGLKNLNVDGLAGANQIACSSNGNCGLAGLYTDGSKNIQAFVASQVNGTWGNAVEVPGTAALNAGGTAATAAISCPSDGGCSAGGAYTDATGTTQAFVVNESNGVWGTALEIPGTASLNTGGQAAVTSLSCVSVGNCSAGGAYAPSASTFQAFVTTEVAGTWSNAIEVPGSGTLNQGGSASVYSISCTTDGSCAVAGQYTDSSNNFQTFVTSSVAAQIDKKSPPGAPTIKVSSPIKGDVSIALLGVATNGEPISRFQYSLNNGPWINAREGASKSFLVGHLSSGKIYHVRLRAWNVSGPGVASRVVTLKVK